MTCIKVDSYYLHTYIHSYFPFGDSNLSSFIIYVCFFKYLLLWMRTFGVGIRNTGYNSLHFKIKVCLNWIPLKVYHKNILG